MRILLLVTVMMAALVQGNAQLNEKIVVKAGENIAHAISPNGYYRFPQFTEGVFTLKNGAKSQALFNYHIANGVMQYIGDKNDTLDIGIPEEIVDIVIGGKHVFIFNNKSYLEIVAQSKAAKLAKKARVSTETEKKGAYGEAAPASSQSNLKNFTLTTGMYQLSYDIAILKSTSYYWADDRNSLQIANKKNSIKLVSKDKQPKLEAWIDENKINFNSEEDLNRLLQFTETL